MQFSEEEYGRASFTQWESYFALDERVDSRSRETLLLYTLPSGAPRSPRCSDKNLYDPAALESMATHFDILDTAAYFRQEARNQNEGKRLKIGLGGFC